MRKKRFILFDNLLFEATQLSQKCGLYKQAVIMFICTPCIFRHNGEEEGAISCIFHREGKGRIAVISK